jgi:hypothetical protein
MTPEDIAVSALAKLNDNFKITEGDSGKVKGKRDVDGKVTKGSLKRLEICFLIQRKMHLCQSFTT